MRKRKRPVLLKRIFWVVVAGIALILIGLAFQQDSTPALSADTETLTPAITTVTPLITTTPAPSTRFEPTPDPVPENLGTFKLSAYCPCVKCCGIWSAEHPSRIGTDFVQKTKSGTIPTAGRTIAVDPEVIPLGTTVLINGIAYVAEDVGGAVKGNHADIFFNDHAEACAFGLQEAEVFLPAK